MLHSIQTVQFKRTKDAQWEEGIMVNDDVLIIDSDAKPVKGKVWDYKLNQRIVLTELNIGAIKVDSLKAPLCSEIEWKEHT